MKVFKTPVISGKDSLSSTYRSKDGAVIKIPPVLCISVMGKIPDAGKTVTSDFKQVGSTIVLVGKMDVAGMGGSTYLEVIQHVILGSEATPGSGFWTSQNDNYSVPKVDLKILPKTFDAIYNGIQTGKILSSHDVSEGGVIGAIFEMSVGGDCGVSIHLGGVIAHLRGDKFLFNETAGCFIVEVENEKIAKQLFKNVPFKILGKTKEGNKMEIYGNKEKLFVADVDDLKKAWQEPMRRMFP